MSSQGPRIPRVSPGRTPTRAPTASLSKVRPASRRTATSLPTATSRRPPQAYGSQPPSYGQPQEGTYGQPPYGQHGQGQPGASFQMPADRPRSFQEVMPAGGFSGMFKTQGLPTEIQVSYWIWLVSGALGVIFGLFGFLAGLALTAAVGGLGALLLVLVLFGIVLAAAQVVLALRMKEGRQWARLALTVLTGVSLFNYLIAMGGDGGANFFGFVVAAVATVLMWLPNSQAWFQRVAGRA